MAAVLALSLAAITLPASAQGLFGPGKFRVEQSDDRFSTTGLTTRSGVNNRVTKKSAGGALYIDWRGLYLDPAVSKNRDTGKVSSVGFLLHHETYAFAGIGAGNELGLPQRVSFLLPGGRIIRADVQNADVKVGEGDGYNRYTGVAPPNIREAGTLTLSLEDMAAVANAPSVTINVEGSKQSWTIEAKDVSKTFLPNLAKFYAEEIAPVAG